MAGMIRSIFGLTTEDVRQKQLEQQQEMAAQLQEQQGTSPFAATFGVGLGAGLGRGLMSRLGFEDPEMAKAKEVEAAQAALDEQLAGLELDDPQRLYLIGQALIEAGKPEEATRYFALAKQFATGKEELALRREDLKGTEKRAGAVLFGQLLKGYTDGFIDLEQLKSIMKQVSPDLDLSTLENNSNEDNSNNVSTGISQEDADRIVKESRKLKESSGK